MNPIKLFILSVALFTSNNCFGNSNLNDFDKKGNANTLLKESSFYIITDSVKKSKGFLSRESIDKMIVNLNQKIAAVELEQKEADSKEKGLFGKLTQELGNNFREQKLSYFNDLKDFLENQKQKLDNINQKVSKILD